MYICTGVQEIMSKELVGFEDVITRLQDGLSASSLQKEVLRCRKGSSLQKEGSLGSSLQKEGSSLQKENFAIPRCGSNGGVFEIHMVCCSVLQCVAVCCSVLDFEMWIEWRRF